MIPNYRFNGSGTYSPALTAADVLEWLKTHNYIYYHAPMDHSPRRVSVTSKVKTWKRSPGRFEFTISAGYEYGVGELRYRVDAGHLDRFRVPVDKWHHGITARLSHERYMGDARKHIVLIQSNGFHLPMDSVKHAVSFARRTAMQLTVSRGKRTRVLVAAAAPISGERNF